MGGVVKSVLKPVNKITTGIFGDELGQALTMAALTAGAIYGGGALMSGVGGLFSSGATVAEGTQLAATAGEIAEGVQTATTVAEGAEAATTLSEAGKAALMSKTGAVAVGQGAISGYQAGAQQKAQAEAEEDARRALKEQELTRKRAMLAEQTSLSARRNAARNVRNNLQGLSTSSKLGSMAEQLGG